MWVYLAFGVAFLTSVQEFLSKGVLKKTDALVVCWAWWAFSLPFLYLFLFFEDIPPLGDLLWPALWMDTVLVVIAFIYYVNAIQLSDLSLTLPMLTFSPLFLLITSPIMLGEWPKPLGIGGVMLIVLGSYLLFLKKKQESIWAPFKSLIYEKGTRFMLMVALIYSITANLDKIGVLNSSVFFWTLLINTSISVVVGLIMLKKCKNIWLQISSSWKVLVTIGILNAAASIIHMVAIKMTHVPYLIAVKRTSVVMAALLGFIFLKEEGFKERMIGIIIMLIGVFLITFS